ncbi:thiol-disulfide oxidoreductase DCC family protein [Pontibacillus marinus]|nr:DUF393 domain-containing protein [Pontibacillus marinus]
MRKTMVLYDRYCFLCQQSKKWLEKMDWLNRLRWVSLQEYSQKHTISEDKMKAMKAELHAITPDQKEHVGYDAMKVAFIRCPLTFVLGILMYIPKSGIVGKPVYRFIAKNRYRLFKSKCKNGSCGIH